jgi:hypothetical protein
VKRELRRLLAEYDLAGIADRAADATRVLGALIPLTYDGDPLIAWRAARRTPCASTCGGSTG